MLNRSRPSKLAKELLLMRQHRKGKTEEAGREKLGIEEGQNKKMYQDYNYTDRPNKKIQAEKMSCKQTFL